MAGYVLFTNPAWNWDTVLNAFRAARQLLWVRLHQIVVFLAVAVALGLAWGTIWGLVVATVISSFTSLIHRIISAREFIRLRASRAELRDGFKALPDLIRFGLKIAPGRWPGRAPDPAPGPSQPSDHSLRSAPTTARGRSAGG